jgi:hypothetical protein
MQIPIPALQLIKCFGLPKNLPIVFTEVSYHFSLFENLSFANTDAEPCVLIIRDSNHTNGIFTIGCNQQHLSFVNKHIDSAELIVDNFDYPQKNWLIKISLLLNQKNFLVEIQFNLNLMQKTIEITRCQSDIDANSNLHLSLLISDF